jgi:hypothetical protein
MTEIFVYLTFYDEMSAFWLTAGNSFIFVFFLDRIQDPRIRIINNAASNISYIKDRFQLLLQTTKRERFFSTIHTIHICDKFKNLVFMLVRNFNKFCNVFSLNIS